MPDRKRIIEIAKQFASETKKDLNMRAKGPDIIAAIQKIVDAMDDDAFDSLSDIALDGLTELGVVEVEDGDGKEEPEAGQETADSDKEQEATTPTEIDSFVADCTKKQLVDLCKEKNIRIPPPFYKAENIDKFRAYALKKIKAGASTQRNALSAEELIDVVNDIQNLEGYEKTDGLDKMSQDELVALIKELKDELVPEDADELKKKTVDRINVLFKKPSSRGKSDVVMHIRKILEEGPLSKEEILQELVAKFPDRDPETMAGTIKTQVPYRINNDCDYRIVAKFHVVPVGEFDELMEDSPFKRKKPEPKK